MLCQFRFFMMMMAIMIALCTPATTAIADQPLSWEEITRLLKKAPQSALTPKLMTWIYVTETDLSLRTEDLIKFVHANPHWPSLHIFRRKIEGTIDKDLTNPEIIQWFQKNPPKTYDGIKSYTHALIKLNQTPLAKTILEEFWTEARLDKKEMLSLIGLYPHLLNRNSHAKRLHHLVWEGRYSEAEDILSLTDQNTQKIAKARIALARMSSHVDGLINAVPQNLQNDTGLIYDRVKWRRRKNMTDSAIDLLALMPNHPPHAHKWWTEISILARRKMENRQFKEAYQILRATDKFNDEKDRIESEWLRGWLSLRFLKDPHQAYKHFSFFYQNVNSAISRSRASYWAGWAAEAKKNADIAKQWYQISAKYPSTFYGQLAHEKIYGHSIRPNVQWVADPVAQTWMAFSKNEIVQVIYTLHKVGADDHIAPFFAKLLQTATSPSDLQNIARLAHDTKQPYYAVQANKDAQQNYGVFLFDQGYPILPTTPLQYPEKGLVHAITYRESMFNPKVVSHAGASGLMQLMPRTAKEVSRQVGQHYALDKLTLNPSYNVLLGSTYLGDLLKKYDGSYPLAIAAYNAGPGNVNKWLRELGDPRTGEIELIDWMELVPIYETRNYMQRVMETYYIYQMKFQKKPLTISNF